MHVSCGGSTTASIGRRREHCSKCLLLSGADVVNIHALKVWRGNEKSSNVRFKCEFTFKDPQNLPFEKFAVLQLNEIRFRRMGLKNGQEEKDKFLHDFIDSRALFILRCSRCMLFAEKLFSSKY